MAHWQTPNAGVGQGALWGGCCGVGAAWRGGMQRWYRGGGEGMQRWYGAGGMQR